MAGHHPMGFDADLAAIGYIEPEFVTEIVGWANEEILIDADMLPIATWGSPVPITWVSGAFTRQPTPEPIPIKRTRLVWRKS